MAYQPYSQYQQYQPRTQGQTRGQTPTLQSALSTTGMTTSPWAGTQGSTGFGSQQGGGALTFDPNQNANAQRPDSQQSWGTYTTQPVSPQARADPYQQGAVTGPPTTNNWWSNWQGMPSGQTSQTGQYPLNQMPGYPASPPTPQSGQTGQQTNPGTQATQGFTWSPPSWMMGQDQAGWADPAMSQAMANYQGILPYVQAQQNAYQYGQDFTEAQRRWDEQFGWTQQTDQFNMGLAQQQQAMAQWTAQQQQGNWQNQYNLDTELGRGALGVDQATQQANAAYQQGQIGIAQEQNRIDQMYKAGQLTNEQYANETQRIQAGNQLHLGNVQNQISQQNADTQRQEAANALHLGNEQNRIDQMYKSGMLSNEQYANESQRLYQTGQLSQAANELQSQDWYRRQQIDVANQQNQIDQMYKSGMISNQQRELALAELTQQQNDTYRYAAMTQEAALSRENMTNQQKLTAMNAFGRWQAPNARFVRSW